MRQIILLIIVVGLGACATGSRTDRSLTPEAVGKAVVANYDRVNSLFGTGILSVETPEIAQSASFEIFLRKPDSVLVRIEGPFGIDLGQALLTKTEFFFYNSMQNRLLTGPSNPGNLGRFFRIQLAFDDLVSMLTGGVFLAGDRGDPDDFGIEDDEYVFTYRHPDGVRRYWVEPESFQIVRIHHLDPRGNLLVEQTFGKFVHVGEAVLPQVVRVTMRPERRRISIAYADLSLNPSSLSFRFDVPPDAERVRVQ